MLYILLVIVQVLLVCGETPEERAIKTANMMTYQEMLSLPHGLGMIPYAGMTNAVPRLKIPPLHLEVQKYQTINK
jgi:hypothetical protein